MPRKRDERYTVAELVGGVAAGLGAGFALAALMQRVKARAAAPLVSMADQKARFAMQKATQNVVALAIHVVYDPALLAGKRVLVTGCNRGLGLAIATELQSAGACVVAAVRTISPELEALGVEQVITGCEMTSDSAIDAMVAQVDAPLDIVVNNAGYFKTERESVLDGTMDYADELKTIDICAVALLRVSTKLFAEGKLVPAGAKIAMITSQGGSIAWRDVQSSAGGDYGHHMSKAAANMGAKVSALSRIKNTVLLHSMRILLTI